MTAKQQETKIHNDKLKPQVIPAKVVKTLANSIFQNLREEGFENKDIIGVSSQLIGMVTSAIEEDQPKNT